MTADELLAAIKPAKVTATNLLIDGEPFPWPIADGGITVKPGGYKDYNTVTVEFYVASVEVSDDR